MFMKDLIFSTYGESGMVVTHKPTSLSAFCDHSSNEFKNREQATRKLTKKVEQMNEFLDGVEKIKKFTKREKK